MQKKVIVTSKASVQERYLLEILAQWTSSVQDIRFYPQKSFILLQIDNGRQLNPFVQHKSSTKSSAEALLLVISDELAKRIPRKSDPSLRSCEKHCFNIS